MSSVGDGDGSSRTPDHLRLDPGSLALYEAIREKVQGFQEHTRNGKPLPLFIVKQDNGQYHCCVCEKTFALFGSNTQSLKTHSEHHLLACKDTNCDFLHIWTRSTLTNKNKPCPWADKTRRALGVRNETLQVALAQEANRHQEVLQAQQCAAKELEESVARERETVAENNRRVSEAERALAETQATLDAALRAKQTLEDRVRVQELHTVLPQPRKEREAIAQAQEDELANEPVEEVDGTDGLFDVRKKLEKAFISKYGGETLLAGSQQTLQCLCVDSPYGDALVGGWKHAEGRTKQELKEGQWWVVFATNTHPYAPKRKKALGMCLVSRVLRKDSEELTQAWWYNQQVQSALVRPHYNYQFEVSASIEFGASLQGLCDDPSRHRMRRGKWPLAPEEAYELLEALVAPHTHTVHRRADGGGVDDMVRRARTRTHTHTHTRTRIHARITTHTAATCARCSRQ